MATDYRHFIITLFNVRLWSRDRQGGATLTDAWLQERAALFERYCLPSLAQQTVDNFTWLVLFDRQTPPALLQRIEGWQQQVPQLRPLFFGEEAAELLSKDDSRRALFLRQVVQGLLEGEQTEGGCQWILTTNVDNDDAVHCRMVEALQGAFERERPPQAHLFCFPTGWQLFEQGRVLLRMHYPHNHFLTVAEPVSAEQPPRTVKYFRHTKARKLLPTTDIHDGPMWIEVVHGRNYSNELRLSSRIRYRLPLGNVRLDDFGLSLHLPWTHNVTNALCRVPWLFLRTTVRRLRKKWSRRRG